MSATATATLSDTLVVGRQPQQPVGILPSSPYAHHSPSLPFLPPFFYLPWPHCSNGLDPQFTSPNRPGRVRFSPLLRVNETAHRHPTQATTTTTTSGVRAACCGVFQPQENHAPSWSCVAYGKDDRFFESSTQGVSLRVGGGEAREKIIVLSNEAHHPPRPPHPLPIPFPILRSVHLLGLFFFFFFFFSIRLLIAIISEWSGLQSCLWPSATSTASSS